MEYYLRSHRERTEIGTRQSALEMAVGVFKTARKDAKMRVLISGGGIAGLTLAYWLHHYDIPSLVIEQAQGLRRDGYAIDFLGTG
jgi:ribulose 1,5-bisphosphate synthetase/thiazole synthase